MSRKDDGGLPALFGGGERGGEDGGASGPVGAGGGERAGWRVALGWVRGAFLDNAALKFVALVLSLTVFILVHSDEEAVAGATVDVSYTLPPGKVLVTPPVEQLRITVKGSRRRIRRFDPRDLDRVDLDLRGRGDGDLVFDREMISGLPDGLELVSITPASMTVKLADRVERLVPVVVQTRGAPARGYRVTRLEAVPAQVAVVGTAEALGTIDAVRTAPVAIEGLARELIEEVPLVAQPGVELATPRVRVEVAFDVEQGVRRIEALPVTVRATDGVQPAAAAALVVQPATVEVILRGSTLDLERVDLRSLSAVVPVTAADLTSKRPRDLEVRVVPAQLGIGIEIRPPTVTVRAP